MNTIKFDNLIDPKTGENITLEIEEDAAYLAHLEKLSDKSSRKGQLIAAAHAILDDVEYCMKKMFADMADKRINEEFNNEHKC